LGRFGGLEGPAILIDEIAQGRVIVDLCRCRKALVGGIGCKAGESRPHALKAGHASRNPAASTVGDEVRDSNRYGERPHEHDRADDAQAS
jgi:hypothetical protein